MTDNITPEAVEAFALVGDGELREVVFGPYVSEAEYSALSAQLANVRRQLHDETVALGCMKARAEAAEAKLAVAVEVISAACRHENMAAFKDLRAAAEWYEAGCNVVIDSQTPPAEPVAMQCPPCNQDCNQGRDCPARKSRAKGNTFRAQGGFKGGV